MSFFIQYTLWRTYFPKKDGILLSSTMLQYSATSNVEDNEFEKNALATFSNNCWFKNDWKKTSVNTKLLCCLNQSYPVFFVESLKYDSKINQCWRFMKARIFQSEVRLQIFVNISVICHFHVPLYSERICGCTLHEACCSFLRQRWHHQVFWST